MAVREIPRQFLQNTNSLSRYLCTNPYRPYLCHHSLPTTVHILVHLIPHIPVCLINLMGSLQITKAQHILTNMAPHMELHPQASMPLYTVVPSVISRVHYVVVHPPTNILTNMTPNIVMYMYLQSRSYLEDNRAGVAE